MGFAKLASTRSDCIKRHVGAVLVKDDVPLVMGYNGAARGQINCNEGGCERCNNPDIRKGESLDKCVCVHAEDNIKNQAALHGVSIKDGTLYITDYPCNNCAKGLINTGIKRLVYFGEYPSDFDVNLFGRSGVEVQKLKI